MKCKECGRSITFESATDHDTWSCSDCDTDTGVQIQ